MTRFLIWGGGGHGKVVADLIRTAGHVLIGFIDADRRKLGQEVESGGGCVVILEENFIEYIHNAQALPEGADAIALAVGDNARRLECIQKVEGWPVPPLIHPASVVSPSAVIGNGSVVFAGAVISADATIGKAVIVNTAAIVEHDCRIGDGVHLSPRATLAGSVSVGDRSWIGASATIIQGITVGADAVVGAGAVVIRNVEEHVRVAGVPAVRIRSRAV